MKISFLVSTPRSGSLALSVIQNTNMCLAHHERNDYDLVAFPGKEYELTHSFKMLKEARKQKKNYFCCDNSMATHLLNSFVSSSWFMDKIQEGLIDLNVIILTRNYVDSAKSLIKSVLDTYTDEMITNAANEIERNHTIAVNVWKNDDESRLKRLGINVHDFKYEDCILPHSERKVFRSSFLTKLSNIVGSYKSDDSGKIIDEVGVSDMACKALYNYSRTKEELIRDAYSCQEFIKIKNLRVAKLDNLN